MKSICLFSSYYKEGNIPCYVKFYLEELTAFFSEIVFITNEKELSESDTDFLKHNAIQSLIVKNEGFDFGMWYKGLMKYDVKNYDRIGLVNDSCILFKKLHDVFQWIEHEKPDYAGLLDTNLFEYHVQSYFLVINKNAIQPLYRYFNEKGIIQNLNEVIKTYEVGLSEYMKMQGLKVNSYIKFRRKGGIYNPAFLDAMSLIKEGFPLIKRKIISRGYTQERWWSMVAIGFNPYPSSYIRLIKKMYPVPDDLFKGLENRKGLAWEIKFNVICIIALCSRVFRKTLKQLKNE